MEVPKRVATDVKDLVRGKMVHHTTVAHHWSAAPDHASSRRDCWDPCDDPWAYDDPWRKKSSNNTRLPLPSGASIAGMESKVIEQSRSIDLMQTFVESQNSTIAMLVQELDTLRRAAIPVDPRRTAEKEFVSAGANNS